MDIAVSRIDPTDQRAVLVALDIHNAATAADVPDFPLWGRHAFLSTAAKPAPGADYEWALAHLDGQPAGYLKLELPTLENLENASADIYVRPDFRRRGVGRALHAYAVKTATARGRKRLVGMSAKSLPGGPVRDGAPTAFATALGATSALTEVRRRLDVSGVDNDALDRALADAWRHADGYSLVQWQAPTPEDLLADVSYLDSRLLQDAPMGDLDWEPMKIDSDRTRAFEALQIERKRKAYHTGTRHDATGRLVAWTLLTVSDEPEWHSWQQITIVDPDHRGHRLGTVVKIENLRYLLAAQPAVRYIDTFNAAVNDHMISINELMGFRPVDAWDNWQQEI